MASEKPESDAVLAFFDARIAAWVAAKESYLKAVSLGTLGQVGEVDLSVISAAGGSGVRTPIELPVGAFRSKSIPDAIKLYLAASAPVVEHPLLIESFVGLRGGTRRRSRLGRERGRGTHLK